MQKHKLNLEFPHTANEGIFRIEDTSIYSTSIPVDCVTLEILPPGYSSPTVLTGLTSGFKLTLNACSMGLLVTGCDEICPILPDGIYHIRFSVSPNTNVYVEYNILRVTSTKNKYYKTLCWINDQPCAPDKDKLTLIREMQLIESQITTAQHLVEDLHDYENGVEMLRYAIKRLENRARGCHTCN